MGAFGVKPVLRYCFYEDVQLWCKTPFLIDLISINNQCIKTGWEFKQWAIKTHFNVSITLSIRDNAATIFQRLELDFEA